MAISPTRVAESDALIAQTGSSDADSPSSDVATLAGLLTALPASDRTSIIADLPQEQRLAVAKLIAARITEDNTNE